MCRSATLHLQPILVHSEARLSHHVCALKDTTWRSDDIVRARSDLLCDLFPHPSLLPAPQSWLKMPDASCSHRATPCCGDDLGSWQLAPDKDVDVDVTFWVMQATRAAPSVPRSPRHAPSNKARRDARREEALALSLNQS